MPEPNDLDLDLARADAGARPPGLDPSSGEHAGRRLVLVVVAVALALASVIGWYWWSRQPASPAPATTGQATTEAPVESAGTPRLGDAEAIDLPPLGEMDPTVRTLMGALSARPELARLLATDDLVRRFVVSIDRIGRGASPAAQVAVLRPEGAFSVDRPYSQATIRPESFARYAGVVTMVQSLEPEALARIYGQMRPRLNEAYAELGVPGETFDVAVERAISHLLSVSPDLARGAVVPVKGTTYAWADPTTENLSAAQKHLLRLGPAQAAAVQAHLRRVAQALGIPAERLPAPR